MLTLPKVNEVNLESFKDAEKIIKLLLLKIQEMEEQESTRDQGIFEEILFQAKDTNKKIEDTNRKIEALEDKVDRNTLAIKSLEMVTVKGFKNMNSEISGMRKEMSGGFDNIGKILQEISDKLDKL